MAATLSPDARQSAKDTAESVKIKINGAPLGEEMLGHLLEVQVRDNLLMPDWAVVRIRDPDDSSTPGGFKIGDTLEIALGADKDQTQTTVFNGEIVALEPEYRQNGAILGVRAFDKGHRLNRKKVSKTFINMKAEDIVKQLIGAAGVAAGDIQSTGVVVEHIQQSQETDWALCWRLARANGCEFGVSDGKAYFRKRATTSSVARLKWQEDLTTFSARVSGVGQVSDVTVNSHDPKAGQATSGTSSPPQAVGSAPIWSKRSSAAQALGGGTALVADRVAASTSEAKSMASAALARNVSAFVEADGMAKGSPKLRAGATITIAGVDSDFCGDYVLSATTHIYRGGGAYTTKFEITGDRSRTFAQLAGSGGGASPTGGAVAGGGGGDAKSSWAQQLVIGVVDNNNDPDKLGRVKVKYPALGDNMVSDWARVATSNAGKGRGLFMLPQVGDEVVVGFEHGDPRRPFVLGSLYTGTKAPLDADLMDGDGQKSKFAVKTDHQVLLHSQKEMKLHTEEKLTVEVRNGDMSVTGDANVKTEARQNFEAKASSGVKIEGTGSVELKSSGQVKVEGSTVSISGSGMVEVKGSMIKLG